MSIPPWLVAPFISGFYRLWCATLRYRQINEGPWKELQKSNGRMVFCLWHDELFGFPHMRQGLNLFTVVSRSRDGDYLAKVLEDLTLYPLRGSSSRGGLSVLLRGAKLMRERNMSGCITVDGPRGPRHEAKDGALYLAHRAGAYIVPMRAVYAKAKKFGSWDRFQLPYPFSRVTLTFADPYRIEAKELTAGVLAEERQKLKAKLDALWPEETA